MQQEIHSQYTGQCSCSFIETELPKSVEIRDMNEHDITRVTEIIRANLCNIYQDEMEGNEELREQEIAEYITGMRDSFDSPGQRTYLVAVLNEVVVGILGCIHNDKDYFGIRSKFWQSAEYAESIANAARVIKLMNFYVDPEYQNQGIGGRLWYEMIERVECFDQNPTVVAFSSRDYWKAAHAFYTKQGWEKFYWDSDYYHFDTSYFFKIFNIAY